MQWTNSFWNDWIQHLTARYSATEHQVSVCCQQWQTNKNTDSIMADFMMWSDRHVQIWWQPWKKASQRQYLDYSIRIWFQRFHFDNIMSRREELRFNSFMTAHSIKSYDTGRSQCRRDCHQVARQLAAARQFNRWEQLSLLPAMNTKYEENSFLNESLKQQFERIYYRADPWVGIMRVPLGRASVYCQCSVVLLLLSC